MDADLIIVGGGPAGLAAGLYASRAKIKTLLLEQGSPGGQAALTYEVENYPGVMKLSGPELISIMVEQVGEFGLAMETTQVTRLYREENHWVVLGEREYRARAVILATGGEPRKLGVGGEERLAGRGVSYCATCDGPFFRDKKVVVVGGGDSALEEAVFLARFAREVWIVHRSDTLRGNKLLQERAMSQEKISLHYWRMVEEIQGDERVEKVLLRNLQTDEVEEITADGVFIYIGYLPRTKFLKGLLNLDPWGYVPTDERMATGLPGLYAIGDMRVTPMRQIVTAVSDGAIAAMEVEKYLVRQEG